MRISTAILTALLAAAVPLHAEVLNITLDVNPIILGPGQSFDVSAVITNMVQGTVDLNDIEVTLDGSLFQVDLSPFFSGPATVAAGGSTPSFPQFSVTVDTPYTGPPGIQTGTLTILGGVEFGNNYDPTTQDIMGSVPFSVDVVIVPEPSTFAPAILAGIAILLYSRRKSFRLDRASTARSSPQQPPGSRARRFSVPAV